MKTSSIKRGIPAGNPIANVLVIIVGALAIGASVVLGLVAFVVLGSIVAVLAGVIGLRLWWFNRKLAKQSRRASGGAGSAESGVIEGEFHEVSIDTGRDGNGENNVVKARKNS